MTTPITSAHTVPSSIPTRTGVAAGPDEAAQRLAWQREMEHAQLGAWFRSPAQQKQAAPSDAQATPRRSSSANGTGAEPAQGRTVRAERSTQLRAEAMPRASARASVHAAMAASPSFAPQAGARLPAMSNGEGMPPVDERTLPTGNTLTPGKLHRKLAPQGLQLETTPTESPSAGSGAMSARTAEQPAIRLHMEHAPQGATVWIAMHDQDAVQGPMVASLLKELRDEFATRGERLHQLICNGRLLWRDGGPASGIPGNDATPLDGANRRSSAGDHFSLLHPTVSKDA